MCDYSDDYIFSLILRELHYCRIKGRVILQLTFLAIGLHRCLQLSVMLKEALKLHVNVTDQREHQLCSS